MFATPTSILPYLEPTTSGPTTTLAQSLAKRLNCHVVAGYPEALPTAPQPGSSSSSGQAESESGPKEMKALEGEGTGVGYNSAVIVGPGGKVVGNYRKSFRFETDKNWAREGEYAGLRMYEMVADVIGDGFRYFDLGEPLGRTAVGICMGMSSSHLD